VLYSAGVHERDMFTSIAEAALQAVSAVFERTRDDVLLLKTLHGFHSYGKICTYFNMVDPYNALLVSLFRYAVSTTNCVFCAYQSYFNDTSASCILFARSDKCLMMVFLHTLLMSSSYTLT
jgi:hypothetical protein